MPLLRKLHTLSEEDGSVLVFVSLSIVLILAVLGVAIDVGHLRQVKRQLQNAADAAALAAAIEVPACGGSPNCSSMQSAAQSALTENGVTAGTTLTDCTGTPGTGVTLTLNNPACSIATDPNSGKNNYAEAIVSEQVPMYFAALLGMRTITVAARAEGAHGVAGPCIYALDSTGAAIVIVAGVIVKSNCGIVDESTSNDALSCVVGAFLYAPSIQVSGGSAGLLCLATSAPTLHVAAPTPRDPLAYLSAPSNANDSCGTSTQSPYYGSSNAVNLILGGNATFNPGVYCGGISMTASLLSNVTFNPGTYILRDKTGFLGITQGGLSLTLSALSTITGNGVTFYNEGPHGSFSVIEPVTGAPLVSIANVKLTAPSSGNYSGILFFQAHSVTATGNFLANLDTSSNLQGAIYLPDAPVNYGVSALSSSYNFLVAKDIDLNVAVASSFGNDYSSLAGGSPLNGNNSTLVE